MQYVKLKISKSVGRFNLSSKTKLSLYYTLIYPYITWIYPLFGSSSTCIYTYQIQIGYQFACKSVLAVRAITNADFPAHS